MGELTRQEIEKQNRGWFKLGDGVEFVGITAEGELVVKDKFPDISAKLGGQQHLLVRDVSELFKEILVQLKIANAYEAMKSDVTLTELDVGR